MRKRIVVLSGAGMSADSGLATFRDSGGLWEGYNIEDVATPQAWQNNRKNVLEFYNYRRLQAAEAEPNEGHKALAELEKHFDVSIITQNVDDLHEKAGSTDVYHLHGLLKEARSEKDPGLVIDIGSSKICEGDCAEDGAQLRPNIVWFGEPVPMVEKATEIVSDAQIFVVIGTSLVVYPAAGLTAYTPHNTDKYIIDPNIPEISEIEAWTIFEENAATGVPKFKKRLLNLYA